MATYKENVIIYRNQTHDFQNSSSKNYASALFIKM